MRRIDAFTSSPWMNHASHEEMEAYSEWMLRAGRLPKENAVQTAKRVLGKQDYCWIGFYRAWIWERPVKVTLPDGRQITRHWRLFASKRGFQLEIEDGGRPWGETMKYVAPVVANDFMETWARGEEKNSSGVERT